MPFFIGKPDDFVFDRWAVAWTNACDFAGIHRRAMEVLENDLFGLFGGIGNMARDLWKAGDTFIVERKPHIRHRRAVLRYRR